MDPISHAITGAALGAAIAPRESARHAGLAGALAGMAPDLDVFLRSSADPLLHLEFHRGFSHSFAFAPVLALACAALFHPLLRRHLSFGRSFLVCLLAIIAHALLDAATSYGTSLYWPFSDARVGWNLVAVIDPLYTVPPALILGWAMLARHKHKWAAIACGWMALYLFIGGVQRDRAERAIAAMAEARGHLSAQVVAKPSIFNHVVFRTLYRDGDYFHVDAVRVGYFSSARVFPGERVRVFDPARAFPDLPPESLLARDIARFGHFSMGYLYVWSEDPEVVADLRYALVPNSIDPLWGIRVDPAHAEVHAPFETFRRVDPETRSRFFAMLLGSK